MTTLDISTFSPWLEAYCENNPECDKSLIEKAYIWVEKKGDVDKNPFKPSPLQQGLTLLELTSAIQHDNPSLVAALLYPCVHYHAIDQHKISQSFGHDIAKLIHAILKLELMEVMHSQKQHNAQQVDKIRKMLLSIVDDIRIIPIKLMERLATMHYVKNSPRTTLIAIGKQIQDIYAPLANRLGYGDIKWQLEDFAFRFINPETYHDISKLINMRRKERDEYIINVKNRLEQLINDSHITHFEVNGRAKHIYSIYRKMKRKDIHFDELYDANAFRILVDEIQDCYKVLSIVHNEWPHIAKEFDDYIANPKPNGYRSIHTAVTGPNNINIEIQIRTYKIHQESEFGAASHWLYKEGKSVTQNYEDKINLLRELVQWQQEVNPQASHETDSVGNLFHDRIYVFTPNGDLIDLPEGATALDFAYHIHTDLGHCCKGAKINDKLTQLTRPLQTGDRVSILTHNHAQPSRDWLNPELGYIKSHRSRQKIQTWFRHHFYQDHLNKGQDIWDKSNRTDIINREQLSKCAHKMNFKSADDLLAALGANEVSLDSIINKIVGQPAQEVPAIKNIKPTSSTSHKSHVIMAGVNDLVCQLSRCCKPIVGDDIAGYITQSRGITVHKTNCNNLKHALQKNPERQIHVNWDDQASQQYKTDLDIRGNNRPGIIRDITAIATQLDIEIISMHTFVNEKNGMMNTKMTIEIPSKQALDKIITKLQQLPDISFVERL